MAQPPAVFRIDHDEKFNQTTHVQYQPWKRAPWVGFNWRYDSGLVAGSVPDFATALTLDGDQQAAIGLFCGNRRATIETPLTAASCNGLTPFGATRVVIPAPGDDDLFHGDRFKWSLRLTAVNLTNREALYNFLSTFSGTHFVTPRAYTAELGLHF